jgi:hypothetical protein
MVIPIRKWLEVKYGRKEYLWSNIFAAVILLFIAHQFGLVARRKKPAF